MRLSAADSPPAGLPLKVLQKARQDWARFFRERGETEATRTVLPYFDRLEKAWNGTLGMPLKDLPEAQRAPQMAFQFYFGGRTNYGPDEMDLVLKYSFTPFNLTSYLDTAEASSLARADMNIRVAWFDFLNQAGLEQVMGRDPRLFSGALTSHFLEEMETAQTVELLNQRDLAVVFQCLNSFPSIDENYLRRLAAGHARDFPGVGHHAKDSFAVRIKYYESVYEPFLAGMPFGAQRFADALLRLRPDLFFPHAFALADWVEMELRALEKLVDDFPQLREEIYGSHGDCISRLKNDRGVLAGLDLPSGSRASQGARLQAGSEGRALLDAIKQAFCRGETCLSTTTNSIRELGDSARKNKLKIADVDRELPRCVANLQPAFEMLRRFVEQGERDEFKQATALVRREVSEAIDHISK